MRATDQQVDMLRDRASNRVCMTDPDTINAIFAVMDDRQEAMEAAAAAAKAKKPAKKKAKKK